MSYKDDLDAATRMAVRIESARDSLRRTMGERYQPMVDRLRVALGKIAAAKEEALFEFTVGEALRADGIAAMQLLAAAAEIAENRP